MAKKKQGRFSVLYAVIFLTFSALSFFVLQKTFTKLPCANSLSCKESLELSVNNDEEGVFDGEKVDPPDIDLADLTAESDVLGTETEIAPGEKRIEVDLSTQTLKAYEGDTLFMEAKVSTGKWAPTPTGEFTIWTKIRSAKMSGGQGADYYYLPNVPYIMFFSNSKVGASRGYSLHGAYWHNNFGHAMSHGCVNMRTIDAKKLYYWADPYTAENKSQPATKESPGTKIIIYGEAS